MEEIYLESASERRGESYSLAARGMTHLLPADRRKDGWLEEEGEEGRGAGGEGTQRPRPKSHTPLVMQCAWMRLSQMSVDSLPTLPPQHICVMKSRKSILPNINEQLTSIAKGGFFFLFFPQDLRCKIPT